MAVHVGVTQGALVGDPRLLCKKCSVPMELIQHDVEKSTAKFYGLECASCRTRRGCIIAPEEFAGLKTPEEGIDFIFRSIAASKAETRFGPELDNKDPRFVCRLCGGSTRQYQRLVPGKVDVRVYGLKCLVCSYRAEGEFNPRDLDGLNSEEMLNHVLKNIGQTA